MKMKNVLLILISLAVVFAMVGAVGATSINHGDSSQKGQMLVNYTVPGSYIVTIPSDVTFASGSLSSGQQTVNATNVMIESGKKLNVTLTSEHYWENGIYNLTLESGDSVIPYYIEKLVSGAQNPAPVKAPVSNGEVILSVPAGTKHPSALGASGVSSLGGFVEIIFSTNENFIDYATRSGNHIDTLTFTVSVE